MDKISRLTAAAFDREVLDSELPVLVDFYAPWCMPCQMLDPVLEKLAEEFSGRVKVVKVNVDDEVSTAARYRINGVPTLMLFNHGVVEDSIVGLVPPQVLREKVERVAVKARQPEAV